MRALSLGAFDAAGDAKELPMLDGGHFGLVSDDTPTFRSAVVGQAEFLLGVLS